jgi:hypothetical protein
MVSELHVKLESHENFYRCIPRHTNDFSLISYSLFEVVYVAFDRVGDVFCDVPNVSINFRRF